MTNVTKVVQYVPDLTTANPLNIRLSLVDIAAQQTTATADFNPTLDTITHPYNRRKKGIKPRYFRLVATVGTAPLIKTIRKNLVILHLADFDAYINNAAGISPPYTLAVAGVTYYVEAFIREELVS
jgi:hypothetical protein